MRPMKGKIMHKALTLCLLGLAAGGCAEPKFSWFDPEGPRAQAAGIHLRGEAETAATGERRPADIAPQPEETPHLAAVEPRKVVYTGQFKVLTDEVGRAVAETRKLAERLGGYMQRMTGSGIVIRVPAARFDQAVAELEKMGSVTERYVQAQDVTEEYVDLEIRLKSAKALLAKLLGLLEKAKDVKQALEVEKELARVRTEVERLEGQLNRLASRVAYATITVNFIAAPQAPGELKVVLPFWWLRTLGLKDLMSFEGRPGLF